MVKGPSLTVEPLHFSSIDHAVMHFYLVFYSGIVITTYKMRLKVFKHVVRVCLEVLWWRFGVVWVFWGGLGCFKGPYILIAC